MEHKTQLLDLNDDCLLAIFHQLPQFDYWCMGKVCQRFKQIITNAQCPPNYKHWYDATSAEAAEVPNFELISSKKFKFLWEYMRDVAEQVEVQLFGEKHIELLRLEKAVFPKVHTVKVRVAHNTKSGKYSNIAHIIAKAFPNVERLIYAGALRDGSGLCEMSQLKQLQLYCEDELDSSVDYLHNICERCQLTAISIQALGANQRLVNDFCQGIKMCAHTLEEISVSSDFLVACLREISKMPMPRLRRFAYIDIELFEGEEGCFENDLFSSLAERIYRFGSNFDYIPLPIDSLSDLQNLEEFIINDSSVTCENTQKLTEHFPHLTEIQCWNKITYFQKYSEDDDEDGEPTAVNTLTFLTSLSSNLKILSIPIEWIGDRFELSELSTVLRNQPNRTVPLKLRCLVSKDVGSDERAELLQNLKVHENAELFQISLHDLPTGWIHWDTDTRHYFEIHMKCLTNN